MVWSLQSDVWFSSDCVYYIKYFWVPKSDYIEVIHLRIKNRSLSVQLGKGDTVADISLNWLPKPARLCGKARAIISRVVDCQY